MNVEAVMRAGFWRKYGPFARPLAVLVAFGAVVWTALGVVTDGPME